jgi:hypothetical protein
VEEHDLHVAIRLNPATLDAPLIFSAPLSLQQAERESERGTFTSDVFSRPLNGIPQETFLLQPFDGPLAPFKSSSANLRSQTPFKVHAPEFLNFKASLDNGYKSGKNKFMCARTRSQGTGREECSLFCLPYLSAICSQLLQRAYLDGSLEFRNIGDSRNNYRKLIFSAIFMSNLSCVENDYIFGK